MAAITDQYKTPKQYVGPAICKASCVEPSQAIEINAFSHAGLITHRCCLRDNHEENCTCSCGYRFVKNYK